MVRHDSEHPTKMVGSKITRRGFLLGTGKMTIAAMGFPYVVSSSALGKAGAVAPSERVTMGMIGVGPQGTHNLNEFLRTVGVEVVAVCDVNRRSDAYWRGASPGFKGSTAGREPARQIVEDYYSQQKSSGQYQGCAEYGDFRELLGRSDIDAVTVCTPDHWHGLITIAAARAGKDIYCEKPLTNTVAEGRAVCTEVARYNRVLQTGSHERSRDNARFACELVRNGRIGKLHTIRVNMPNNDSHHEVIRNSNTPPVVMEVPDGFDYDRWLGPTPWAEYTEQRCHLWWRFILSYGGGEMTDRGAHIIDLGQLGNGSDSTGPVEISAKGLAPATGIYDTFLEYKFECKYANGVRLIGESVAPRGIKFEGSDGWVFIHIHGGRLEASRPSLLNEKFGPQELHLGRSSGHHQNFIEAVRSRETTMAPPEVGHRTATICHLVNIAMLLKRKLQWDPQQEVVVGDEEANRMLARPMRSPWRM